ncbi:hypothetical protein [Sediminibacter sp. Hel_I_10]|uniref:hypothetical protein n=1 Tax=Sediminibacter sp. Hel_I_10 TaxID=1392490 RepID=UPI00047EF29A|nr:hypothetical protein [Sediminibacter sp. Hel_I_10]
MNFLNQIINDTLKNHHGKWSRKSLTMFFSFVMAVIVGLWIVMIHYFTERPVNQYAIQVFYGFLMLSGGTSALTVWDKIRDNNQAADSNTNKDILG